MGTVKDPTGAVVSGAKVTAKSVNTGFTREATTNSSGLYTIPTLRPDTYEVTVEASGFEKYGHRIEVAVGSQNDVLSAAHSWRKRYYGRGECHR